MAALVLGSLPYGLCVDLLIIVQHVSQWVPGKKVHRCKHSGPYMSKCVGNCSQTQLIVQQGIEIRAKISEFPRCNTTYFQYPD